MASVDEQLPVERHEDISIPVEDETVMATRYRPRDESGPLPTVLMYTPYRKDDRSSPEEYPSITYLAERGYDVVIADMVGYGASSGFAEVPIPLTEGRQAAAVVEWCATRAWSTGKVGMYGLSYPGVTALKAAVERPEGLATIVPIMAPIDPYTGYYDGGLLSLYGTGGAWAPLFEWLPAVPPSRRDRSGEWSRRWDDRLDGLSRRTPFKFTFLEHERRDEFWRQRKIPFEKIEMPVFAIAGWRDKFAQETIEYLREIDAETRLLVGPWRHTMPNRGRETAIDFNAQLCEWFDYFLKGKENGALDRPSIAYWMERDGGGKPNAGMWRRIESWPGPHEDGHTFALSDAGLVAVDEYNSDPIEKPWKTDQTVGVQSIDMGFGLGRPLDTNADDARSVCFETEPLDRPLEYTGTGTGTIRVTPSTANPFIALRVIDVAPSGEARLVTHDQRRLPHSNSGATTRSVTPGEEVTVPIELKPKSHLFETGHKIRVALSGAFFPLVLPTREQGPISIHSSPETPSTVTLPGTKWDPNPTFPDEIEMGEPASAFVPTPSEGTWQTSRDHLTDTATVTTIREFSIDPPGADRTYHERRKIRAGVNADDPGSAFVVQETEVRLTSDTESVRTRVKSRLSRDSGSLTNEVTMDGTEVFTHKYWWVSEK